jgi:hypothetical protein
MSGRLDQGWDITGLITLITVTRHGALRKEGQKFSSKLSNVARHEYSGGRLGGCNKARTA